MSEPGRALVHPGEDATPLGPIGIVGDGKWRRECVRDTVDCTHCAIDCLAACAAARWGERRQLFQRSIEAHSQPVEHVDVQIGVDEVVSESSQPFSTGGGGLEQRISRRRLPQALRHRGRLAARLNQEARQSRSMSLTGRSRRE